VTRLNRTPRCATPGIVAALPRRANDTGDHRNAAGFATGRRGANCVCVRRCLVCITGAGCVTTLRHRCCIRLRRTTMKDAVLLDVTTGGWAGGRRACRRVALARALDAARLAFHFVLQDSCGASSSSSYPLLLLCHSPSVTCHRPKTMFIKYRGWWRALLVVSFLCHRVYIS